MLGNEITIAITTDIMSEIQQKLFHFDRLLSNKGAKVPQNQGNGRIQAEVVISLFTYAKLEDLLRGVVNSDLIHGTDPYIESTEDLSLWVVTKKIGLSEWVDPSDPERALPTGQVSESETVREAAQRLLISELGIDFPVRLRSLPYMDSPSRAGSERVIAFPFWGVVDISKIASVLGGKDQVGLSSVNSRHAMQDIREQFSNERFDGTSRFGYRVLPDAVRGHYKYLPIDFQKRKVLAIDHDQIVFYAWRRLRYAFDGKVDPMREIGVNPMGANFRLSELQQLYEVSLGEPLQRDAFRRAMLENKRPFIEESGETDSSRQGKPAKVYRLMSWAEPGRSRN
jgi:ADP-ribose pyrophosphatase YjhB (NUDIX family)